MKSAEVFLGACAREGGNLSENSALFEWAAESLLLTSHRRRPPLDLPNAWDLPQRGRCA